MFTVEERDRVRDHVLALAAADERVVAGAVVGSFARGGADRWSDLDLTFALPDGAAVDDVLRDWSRDLADTFAAIHLFDLPSGPAIYRVFLLPGCLQVDVSFRPASEFRAGPGLSLVFGTALDPAETGRAPHPSTRDLFGLAVLYAVHARFSIERGRYWQAEHWIGGIREHALALACRRRGLESKEGRGFDDLPAETLAPFADALVRSVEPADLLRALDGAVAALLRESSEVGDLAAAVEARLRELTAA